MPEGQGSSEEGETPRLSDAPFRPTGFRGTDLSTVILSLRRRSAALGIPPNPSASTCVRSATCSAHLEDQVAPSFHLASELHVSLRTLQRHVTASLGCSPRELIVAVKMHEAKRRRSSEW